MGGKSIARHTAAATIKDLQEKVLEKWEARNSGNFGAGFRLWTKCLLRNLKIVVSKKRFNETLFSSIFAPSVFIITRCKLVLILL